MLYHVLVYMCIPGNYCARVHNLFHQPLQERSVIVDTYDHEIEFRMHTIELVITLKALSITICEGFIF